MAYPINTKHLYNIYTTSLVQHCINVIRMICVYWVVRFSDVKSRDSSLKGLTLFHRILLKVCQFVKSRSRDIRNTSRNTLVQILQALGPSYLGYILKELHSVLQRGYQLHVLCYTVWTLLCSLLGSLKPGQLDSSMELLIEVT